MPPARARRRARGPAIRKALPPPAGKPLYACSDHGSAVALDPLRLLPPSRERGWGPFAESFLRFNEPALRALDVQPQLTADRDGPRLSLLPGGRTGAVPLRSPQTGHVAAGLIVKPRFGWSGVGSVLSETGWHASPEFLELPLVPGSGREVPPWVLAGPVLARLSELLRRLKRGYREAEETLRRPRGSLRWNRYARELLPRGRWDQLPCRFPELDVDPRLRRSIRWALERLHRGLAAVGGSDPVAAQLASLALRLLDLLADVTPLMPRRDELRLAVGGSGGFDQALRRGIEAIAWIVDERGLGGGRELDGLAWQLPLDRLWEGYVEAVVRREAAALGEEVKVARLRETVFPLVWSDPAHRSLGHLAPDVVTRHGAAVHVIDAKYKAHLAELDEGGWRAFSEDRQEAHRADVHQVLAYAALFEAEEIRATLVYPLRQATFDALHARQRDIARADLMHGGRHVVLELRGLPFGRAVLAQE